MDSPNPSPDRIDLAAFLAARDAPCPVCGYNLRSLLTDRCPECGRHLVLAVGTTEPKLGAFILGLVGIAAGWGFCTLLLVFAVIVTGRGSGPMLFELIPLLAGMFGLAFALWGWVHCRRKLSRMSDFARWLVGLGAVALGLVCPIWFILTVR